MSHQDSYKTNIYVLNADGSPLMPCHSQRKAKKWLKTGKAVIVERVPFTVQMTQQVDNPQLQPLIFGEDPGPNNIGVHVIDEQGRSLFGIDIATDNKEVTKHMTKRRDHRHASRCGERKRRQRRQVKLDVKNKKIVYDRKLPQCDEDIHCKVIRNSKARFCNRTRPKGYLVPTSENLVRTHVNACLMTAKFLPISKVSIEGNKFFFTAMKQADERIWSEELAPLTGFDSVEEYVSHHQDGKCILCGEPIEHYHHVVNKKDNGADTVANIVGLCACCHDKVHKYREHQKRLSEISEGQVKVLDRLSTLNIAMPHIIARLSALYPVHVTDGKLTSQLRKKYGLSKSVGASGHYIDAWCIAVSALDDAESIDSVFVGDESLSRHCHVVRQFRRHDRALVHRQTERTYKDENSVTIAKNRHKRTVQLGDSLDEYRTAHGDAAVSRLSVKKSQRSYKNPSRFLPGTVFLDERNCRHVLTGNSSNGKVFLSFGERFNSSKCRVVKRNVGLVFLS